MVHWGTGETGKLALRFVIEHPELELVGLLVSTEEKKGQDAGFLCGMEPTGILATMSMDEIFALEPDCLCYCGTGAAREAEAAQDIAHFLEAGINVCAISLISMFYPTSGPKALRELLQRSCQLGDASFFGTGVEPGIMSGQFVNVALACSGSIRKLTTTEFGNPKAYNVESVARYSMGFGMPSDYVPPRFINGRVMDWWRPVVEYHADLVGVTLEDINFHYETAISELDVDTAFGGVVAGTIGGTMWEVQGLVKNKPAIVLRHVSFIHEHVIPAHWAPIPAGTKDHAYSIEVEGLPSYRTVIFPDNDESTGIDAAVAITAAHVVNSIPTVCAAEPGLLDQTSVGFFSGRNVKPMQFKV